MQRIKTLADIRYLKEHSKITPGLAELIETDFREAAREVIFPDLEPDDQFSLEEYGYLVILEKEDSPEELAQEGLNIAGGEVMIQPEFIELVEAGYSSIYRILVMSDNDCITRFYSPIGTQSPELENFLFESVLTST